MDDAKLIEAMARAMATGKSETLLAIVKHAFMEGYTEGAADSNGFGDLDRDGSWSAYEPPALPM